MTDRASEQTSGAASRHTTPAGGHDHDSPRVVESRRADEPSGPDESKYASLEQDRAANETTPATASTSRTLPPPDRLLIELPHDPVITPAAARALLHLILRATTKPKQPDNLHHPGSSP